MQIRTDAIAEKKLISEEASFEAKIYTTEFFPCRITHCLNTVYCTHNITGIILRFSASGDVINLLMSNSRCSSAGGAGT